MLLIEPLIFALATRIPHTPGLRPAPQAEQMIDLYSTGRAVAEVSEGEIIGFAGILPLETSPHQPLVLDGLPIGFLDVMWVRPDLDLTEAQSIQRKMAEELLERHRDTHVFARVRHQQLLGDRKVDRQMLGSIPKPVRREILRATGRPPTRREMRAVREDTILLLPAARKWSDLTPALPASDGFHVQHTHTAF